MKETFYLKQRFAKSIKFLFQLFAFWLLNKILIVRNQRNNLFVWGAYRFWVIEQPIEYFIQFNCHPIINLQHKEIFLHVCEIRLFIQQDFDEFFQFKMRSIKHKLFNLFIWVLFLFNPAPKRRNFLFILFILLFFSSMKAIFALLRDILLV